MINIPLDELKKRIVEQSEITQEELDEKIKVKLDQLSGLISEEGAAHIVANELGINLSDGDEPLKINNLVAGMKGVEIPGRVVRKYELRTFKNDNGEGQYAKFLFGDETGITMVVLWGKMAEGIKEFDEGDTLLLQDVMVKDGRRGTEIHVSDRSKVEVNPAGVEVEGGQNSRPEAERKSIENLEEGDENKELFVTVVQIFEPKFFERDPETRRKLQKNADGEWENQAGEVVEEPDIGAVMNIYVDDGTDNLRTVLWKPQLLNFLDVDESKLLKYRDNPTEFEPVKTDLLGQMIKIIGRVQRNQVTEKLEFVAQRVITDVDAGEEMKKLGDKKEAPQTKADDEEETPSKKKEGKEEPEEQEKEEKSAKKTDSEPEDEADITDEDLEADEILEEDVEEDVLSLDDLEDLDDEDLL